MTQKVQAVPVQRKAWRPWAEQKGKYTKVEIRLDYKRLVPMSRLYRQKVRKSKT